jgi:hypothetical protein
MHPDLIWCAIHEPQTATKAAAVAAAAAAALMLAVPLHCTVQRVLQCLGTAFDSGGSGSSKDIDTHTQTTRMMREVLATMLMMMEQGTEMKMAMPL